jgi:hypothetical protein
MWSAAEKTDLGYCVRPAATTLSGMGWGSASRRDYMRKLVAVAAEYWEAHAGLRFYEIDHADCWNADTFSGPFVDPTNGAGRCARSIAVGPSQVSGANPTIPAYVWAVGCDNVGDGNFGLWRYTSASGWVTIGGVAAVQIVVDSEGTPWARTVQGGLFKGPLNGSGVPQWQPVGLFVADVSGGGAFRNPGLLIANRVLSYSYGPGGETWLDRGPAPASVTFAQVVSGEPSFAIDTIGRVWRSALP